MITDASIAAALLWPELAALATIYGPATANRAPWRVEIGHWTLTADIAGRSVAVSAAAQFIGLIGPGETTTLDPDTARHLRRDLHEHVYQHHRSKRL
jgi:hypothetical protein